MSIYDVPKMVHGLVDLYYTVTAVSEKLRQVESCAAAKIEVQTCDACIQAKWAARELRRALKKVEGVDQ